MEVSDHIAIDLANVINVTKDRLTHHMVSITVEIDVFHQCFLGVLINGFQLLPDCVFLQFEVIAIINTVAEHVAQDFNRGWHTFRETQCMV
jgi:hypothetical protein